MLVRIFKIKTLILFLFFLSISSYAIEIKLKLAGSLLFLNQDHINRSVNDWEELLKKTGIGSPKNKYIYKEGEVKNLNKGISFEGEFIISFTPRLAVGLGTGFIYSELDEEKTSLTFERDSKTVIIAKPFKINAFPVNLSVYYFHPLMDRLRLYVRGGTGLVWAKYIEREGNYFEQTATDQGQSFFLSPGLIYEATSFMQFFIEGEAKFLRLDRFQGEIEGGESGALYFFEEYNQGLEFWQAKMGIKNEKPSGENVRSVEEAVIDLGGFSVKIGFVIKF